MLDSVVNEDRRGILWAENFWVDGGMKFQLTEPDILPSGVKQKNPIDFKVGPN